LSRIREYTKIIENRISSSGIKPEEKVLFSI
jgi:hypothetical protein